MDFADLAALGIHDVKNRLAALAVRADARGDGETLRDAMDAAASLSRLLAVYKDDQGRLAPAIDARVPADLLEELTAETARMTPLAIEAELAAAPGVGYYDEGMLRMVLQNAVHNALRHARSRIVLAARAGDGGLEFSVRDDGPGYPPEMLGAPLAMHPASREGSGLGLYLAARVAALHASGARRGRVELANDGGAVFRIFLP